MKLLDKLQYLSLMAENATEIHTPSADAMDRVLQYATDVFPTLQLKLRDLKAKDVVAVFEHGDKTMYHVKAYPRKMPDTHVIVVMSGEAVCGHILIDLAAEYAAPYFECPALEVEGELDAADVQRLLPQIRADEDNPFAVLGLADGTYMQTYRTDEGFYLEYQLVNTSSHYEIPELATCEEVVSAMLAYGFGKDKDWLTAFDWQRQNLD